MPYVVGPYIDDPETGGFKPPEWAVGASLDISSKWTVWLKPESVVDPSFRPVGVFAAESLPVGFSTNSAYEVIADGSELPTLAGRDLWARTCGYRPSDGHNAKEILQQTLRATSGDDSRDDVLKAFSPNRQNTVDIRIGNRVVLSEQYTVPEILEQWQLCTRLDLQTKALAGGESLQTACKQVGYLTRRWPGTTADDWITPAAESAGLVKVTPATTVFDDFDSKTNVTDIENSTVQSASILQPNGANLVCTYRLNQSLSASDMAVTVTGAVSVGGTNNQFAVAARQPGGSTLTLYYTAIHNISSGDVVKCYKRIAGSFVQLGSSIGVTLTGLHDGEIDVSGSSIDNILDSVSKLVVSDSSITSGTYFGGHLHYVSGTPNANSINATDGISSPANITAIQHHYSQLRK